MTYELPEQTHLICTQGTTFNVGSLVVSIMPRFWKDSLIRPIHIHRFISCYSDEGEVLGREFHIRVPWIIFRFWWE